MFQERLPYTVPETAVMSDKHQEKKNKLERDNAKWLFCSKKSGDIAEDFFSTSESWHTANALLGALLTSRHWHIDTSKLGRTRNHSLALRPSGMAWPLLHSVALGYKSF